MPMTATVILATSAQLEGSHLSLLGGGWTVRRPDPVPSAVAVLVMIPRDQMGTHHAHLELRYADDTPVMLDTLEGPQTLAVETDFSAQGLDDPALSTPLDAGFVINLGPLPLPPGREFLWRLHIDGETRDEWVARFRTTPPEPEDQA